MNSLVITTIASPNKCLKSIAKNIKDKFRLIIIGDKKSPKKFKLQNSDYYSLKDQLKIDLKTSRLSKINHYSRKNIGYLIAFKEKSEFIYETDDDNFPYKEFYKLKNLFVDGYETENKKFINIYKYFSNQIIWPRGYPLNYIKTKYQETKKLNYKKNIYSPVQQYLADGEPDVDAIFRLVFDSKDFKKSKNIYFLKKKTYCPFNSQNTVWHRSIFPLMYLPVTCSFRLTDIYRSYIAQRILFENNAVISFHSATVKQIRNAHNLIQDFSHEIDGYTKIEEFLKIIDKIKLKKGKKRIISNLKKIYNTLIIKKFFHKKEKNYLNYWIEDIKKIDKNMNF